jgi:hypothetical protein
MKRQLQQRKGAKVPSRKDFGAWAASPDALVRCGAQAQQPRLSGTWENVPQALAEFVAEIMVEQQLHAA